MKVISRRFYERDTAFVAKELLGKVLVRRIGSDMLSGRIVEVEAYYGRDDPASRAYSGRPKFCVKLMHERPGLALIYMVHGNWLLNLVAHEEGKVGAVLIRAIEPLDGIEFMKRNRGIDDIFGLTNGPGKLAKALAITKELNGVDVTCEESVLTVVEGRKEEFRVSSSHRIGVRKDLKRELRFFIEGNRFVSK